MNIYPTSLWRPYLYTCLAGLLSIGCQASDLHRPNAGDESTETRRVRHPLVVPAGRSVRVVSANIGRAGRSSPDSPGLTASSVLDELVVLLDGLRRDDGEQWNVFALQEVDRWRSRSDCEDQAWEIDDSFSHYDGVNPYTGYGHTYATTLGGLGECSRSDSAYGIATVTNHLLTETYQWPLECGSPEPRTALALHLFNAPTPFWVVNTHLAINDATAVCQVSELISRVESVIPPDDIVLIVGDLNIAKESWAYWDMFQLFRRARFREIGGLDHTVPADPNEPGDEEVIDYGFLRDPSLTLSAVARQVVDPRTPGGGDVYLTDHRIVAFDLHWGSPLHASLIPQL